MLLLGTQGAPARTSALEVVITSGPSGDGRIDRGVVRTQQKHAQERPLLGRLDCDRAPFVRDLERPENPELHTVLLPPAEQRF